MTSLKEKILSYDRPVPRYTSYPTAPHFKESFPRETYVSWLGSLEKGAKVSLYFHIPFCDVICFYCGCHTKATKRYDPVSEYVDFLLNEIDMIAPLIPNHVEVQHLHFGGGSPTILQPDDFKRIMDKVHHYFTFAPDAELALEGDPRGMANDKLHAYKQSGINRVSLGVQDFDEKVMKTINRVQPYDVVRDCVDRMRDAGIHNLNMDFIYGLPYQTLATTEDTMQKALDIGPDRLALFGYAHVPWMKKHMRLIKDETLPDKSLRYDLFEKAADMLEDSGFEAIGIDHFAKGSDSMAVQTRAGKLRRNFQGYTTDAADALIGFGVSSIGELPGGYVQNLSHNVLYKDVLNKNLIPIYRGYELSQVDKLHKAAIEQLMCHFRLDVGGICQQFGFPENAADNCFDYLSDLVGDDLVKIEGRVVTINPQARQIARIAAAAFDAYLHQGQGRHSQAV